MIEAGPSQQSRFIIALWGDVVGDLRDVFDVHFVCATFARHIAGHAAARTLVAIADGDSKQYDLWLCEPGEQPVQRRWSEDEAGLTSLLNHDKPTYLDKLERPAVEVISSKVWLETRRQLLLINVGGGRAYSAFPTVVVALIDPPEDEPIERQALQEISDLMCVYLDRAALRQDVDQRTVEFAVITDVSRALGSTLNIQQIYELLTGPVRRVLNVETLSIGLVDQLTGDIEYVERLLGPQFQKLPKVRLKKGQGIAGWVAEHKEPVIINNAYSDKRFFSGVDQRSGFRTSSMICIPLIVDERTIGILQAINRTVGKFSNHDLELMQAIGGPLAAAIENANLHDEVRGEKRRIEALLASLSAGLVTVNREGILANANSGFATLLGEEAGAVIGRPLRDLLRPFKSEIDDLLGSLFAAPDDEATLTLDIPRNGGRPIPVYINGTTVKEEDGSAREAILLFTDLTDIREVERMRDDLFQSIMHEFRTPLATILMYARLIREGKARQPDKMERFLGVIERESDRLQRLIRQLMHLAKLDAQEMQRQAVPVLMNPLLDEALAPMADRAVEKGLLFRQRIEQELPAVLGNAEVVEMALRSLLENAIKFTPSGSVQVVARREEDAVVIDVSDEGIGIPPEAIKHLFKRFYRAQTAVERGLAGSGLSLYMVKEGLKQYNGEVMVQSTPGKGSVFTLRLPVAPM